MELGNEEASSYGCGTYRMFLILPEEEKNLGCFADGGFFCISDLYQWRTGRGSGES